MNTFGDTLFGGSWFIRLSLTPFVVLFALIMPIAIPQWTPARVALMVGMEFMCIALLAGFWLPARYGRWAFRVLAFTVFLCYLSYLIYEFFFSDAPFGFFERRAEASPRNALFGFVIIGLPSLWYALLGRFNLKSPQPEPAVEQGDSEHEES